MPIYEYTCDACGRKASLFFRSISVAEDNPECPHCGEQRLQRRMSRVWSRQSRDADAFLGPSVEDGGVPFYGDGADYGGGSGAYGDEENEYGPGEFGEEDVAAFARETRQMATMMGESLDEDLDTALRHIEGGADPDDVMGELDASSVGNDSELAGDDGRSGVDA